MYQFDTTSHVRIQWTKTSNYRYASTLFFWSLMNS